MPDTQRVQAELDQKHHMYTKKFALIKARLEGFLGELGSLEARLTALEAEQLKKKKK